MRRWLLGLLVTLTLFSPSTSAVGVPASSHPVEGAPWEWSVGPVGETPAHEGPCRVEPFGAPVLGAMEYDAGRLVFVGDLTGLQTVPQPFTDNYLAWLLPSTFGQAGAELALLVDASRDDGGWWFPQDGLFDPQEPHLGKLLADYFRTRDLTVVELPRGEEVAIDTPLLEGFDLVLVPSGAWGYSEAEVEAYEEFVRRGGGLLLAADHTRDRETGNPLSLAFDIAFHGTNIPTETAIIRFAQHPLTEGVTGIPFLAGSGLVEFPSQTVLLGWLPPEVFLDFDDDEVWDSCEEEEGETKPSGRSILVDATRDGGVWWAPQTAPFDPAQLHQGKPLADYFRSLGHAVEELPRSPRPALTLDLLREFDIVLAASPTSAYTASEVAAYRAYVELGGRLLIASDHHGDVLSPHFGLDFRGISVPTLAPVTRFVAHPLTHEVTALPFLAGSGLFEPLPEGAEVLGWLTEEAFLDLDGNGVREASEPVGPPVLGAMPFGDGRVVFFGDLNGLETVPHPFTDNYLEWLLAERKPEEEPQEEEHDINVELDFEAIEVTISLESRTGEQRDTVTLNFEARRGEMKVSFRRHGAEREEVEMRIAFHELIEFKDLDGNGAFDLLDDRVIQQIPIEALTVGRLGTAPFAVGGNQGQQISVNYSFPGAPVGNFSLLFSVLGQSAILDGVPVRPSEAKVDVRVDDFPFAEPDSALAVDVVIRTEFEVRAEVTLDQVIAQGEEFATFFRWSTAATVDGRTVPVEATIFSQRLEAEVEGNAGAFENRTRVFFAYPQGAQIVHGATVGKVAVAPLPLASPPFLALAVGVGSALLLVLGGRSLMRRRR